MGRIEFRYLAKQQDDCMTDSQYNRKVNNSLRQLLCCGNSYANKARDGETGSISVELEVKLQ